MQYKSNILHFTTYKNGTDAIQYYTWIKYADSPTSGMSDIPEGKKYIGIGYNKETKEESTNYDDYQWSLIQGESGSDGNDGKTYYTWVKYADDVNGTNMSDDPTGKYYIGLAYNKETSSESNVAGDYTWSLFRGSDGVDGKDGTKIIFEYAISDSSTTAPEDSPTSYGTITSSNTKLGTPEVFLSVWSTTIPDRHEGQYVWQRTISIHPDGTVTVEKPTCLTGDKGDRGEDGTSVKILGSYETEDALKTAHPTGNTGDGYMVGKDLYVWNGTDWINVGQIKGEDGKDGKDGTDATIKSSTPPTDVSKLWLDTSITPNLLKYFNGTVWVRVNDHTEDIVEVVNRTNLVVDSVKQEINASVSQTENDLLKRIAELTLELERITLEVNAMYSKTEFTKGEDIQTWESSEVPTLMNYPTFTDFFIWNYCSDTLYCNDYLTCGTNDYQSHENEVLFNDVIQRYYMFVKDENGTYYWKELSDEEYKEVSNYYSSIMVQKEKIRMENIFNENVGYAELSHEGLRASNIYCC